MAATDSRYLPLKGQPYRLYFAVRDATGALKTTWSGLSPDSEVSKDGGDFTDCTNEATEIQTSGCGYLELTATEMAADAVVVKIAMTGALTLVFTINPEGRAILGGQVAAGSWSTTVFESDDITEATADHFNGRVIVFTSGNLLGQACTVEDYEKVSSNGSFTVSTLTEAPAENDTFSIY